MKCQYAACTAEFEPRVNRNGTEKLYCKASHKAAASLERRHPKRKHPKRVRSRERERLYTIIHRGESLAYLREQAMEAVRVQALRKEEMRP